MKPPHRALYGLGCLFMLAHAILGGWVAVCSTLARLAEQPRCFTENDLLRLGSQAGHHGRMGPSSSSTVTPQRLQRS